MRSATNFSCNAMSSPDTPAARRSPPPDDVYDAEFFARNAPGSESSAQVVLSLLYSVYSPASVVDIGCGSGTWLARAGALGSTTLTGYDGPWVDTSRLRSEAIQFNAVDLSIEAVNPSRHDLAVSVEFGEHLPEARSRVLVDALCGASDVIVFSAATPGQGGVHHVNEQPQSYWLAQFDERGYEPYDVFRPTIWHNTSVKWWYRQNIMLYVLGTTNVIDRATLAGMQRPIIDAVHPENMARKVDVAARELAELRAQLKARDSNRASRS